MSMRALTCASALIFVCSFSPGLRAQDGVIAYEVPAGTTGFQDFGGTVGMDFDVELDILVTRLGVCDSGSDGLARTLTARLFDRESLNEIATLVFTPEDPGELVGGSRFKDLDEALDLPAGFQGCIVAEGYGADELLANNDPAQIPFTWTTNSGGCSIAFVGLGRWGDAGFFPGNIDGGPANRYAAGTFEFEPLEETVPTGAIAYVVPEFTLGATEFAGPLGNDFVTNVPIDILRLGVFDDGSDGLNLPITARLYDRGSGAELASLVFDPGDGDPVGGSQFLDLDPPLKLPAGFEGTVVAEGYGAGELYVQNLPELTVDTGGCAVEFGYGRWGDTPGVFPPNPAFGSNHVYAAGTFEFEPSDDPVEIPEPPTGLTAAPADGRVDLSWTAPAGGPAVAGYNVYQTRPGALQRLNPAPVIATSFTVADLVNGVEACFVVRATVESGFESSDSNEACATPETEDRPDELHIAYGVPAGVVGNQAIGDALGMDFEVNATIAITRLGVFDDGSDGLAVPIVARLFDRDAQTELASIEFTPAEPGELVGGSRFKDLPALISLDAGFRGTITAEGYGDLEMNGNQGAESLGLTTDGADCAISFGGSRFGPAGLFPPTNNNAPVVDAFAAGTFEYGLIGGAVPPEAEGGIAYLVPEGAVGNQDFGGVLGMHFIVNEDIEITDLGVFDSGSDGLMLPIAARLYDTDAQTVLAALDFDVGETGELIDGSRFLELDEPIGLPAGFRGTIVAEGYGATELLGNQGPPGFVGPALTDDGGCLISFIGGGSYGTTPGEFPNVADGGPANRYRAGTFRFIPAEGPIDFPPQVPTGLTVAEVDSGIALAWQPPSGPTPAASYRVFRSAEGAAYEEVTSTGETRYVDTDVTDGFEYCYKVRSVAENTLESDDTLPICATAGARVEGRVIAYEIAAGTLGNTLSDDAFGLDFDVELDIAVTRLGVFDDGSNGLGRTLTVVLYDREFGDEVESVEISADQPGALIGATRLVELDEPLDLPAGFQGSIVAYGFGDLDPCGVGAAVPVYANPGPCALSFVGSRRDLVGAFPAIPTDGTNPYAAGTFEFEAAETLPPGDGGIAYVVPEGTVGNQAFGGPLGMDFDVQHGISITSIGVFDDSSDGLNLPITAYVYDRDTREALVTETFTPEDPGELDGGSRFKELATALRLPPGFRGSVVAEGYGFGEQNGNQGAVDLGLTTDSGDCLIAFVGGGRYGVLADVGLFPAVVDTGPPNRYAAGTFVFEADGGPPPGQFRRGDPDNSGGGNITDAIAVLNHLFAGLPRPVCWAAADANGDGGVNVSDPVYQLNFLFGGGNPPPAPGPDDCGPGTAADDALGCDEYTSC